MRLTPTIRSFAIGGALLAFAAFASTADARMMGGGSMSSSMSHGDMHGPTSALGSPRGFSPDGHSFSPDGRSFSASGRTFSPDGLETRVKGSNWKKPIDSDQGGNGDPLPKASKTPTRTGSNGDDHPGGSGGYHGGWNPGHHQYGYYGPDDPSRTEPPLACRGRINGC